MSRAVLAAGVAVWGAGYFGGLLRARRLLTIHADPSWGEIAGRLISAWGPPALLTVAGGLVLAIERWSNAEFIPMAFVFWYGLHEFYDEPPRWMRVLRPLMWVLLLGIAALVVLLVL